MPIPVIIFSAVPHESERLEQIRPNTRLVLKPFSLTLLAETLRQMLNAPGVRVPSQTNSARHEE